MKGAHRATYELFYGQIEGGLYVLHRCGRRCCCNPDHLYLGTQKQNMSDMIAHGTVAIGSRHGQAKLTESDVLAIRRDERMRKDIASDYGVSPTAIHHIKTGSTWSWLQP